MNNKDEFTEADKSIYDFGKRFVSRGEEFYDELLQLCPTENHFEEALRPLRYQKVRYLKIRCPIYVLF